MLVDYRKEGHIAIVALNRPEAKNAMNAQMFKELSDAWEQVAADDEVRVAVVYSKAEDIFCAGLDLKSVIPILTHAREAETEEEKWMVGNPMNAFNSLLRTRTWDKPVVAAVHGLCLTAGFEMVMGTDLRVASTDALFQMREATYGIMPTGGSNVFLPRQIPLAAAKEILCLGQEVPAKRLYDWGFLNSVVEKGKLMDEAMRIANRIADNGPLSVQGILRCIRETIDIDTSDAMMKELEIGMPIFASADAREGIKAFKEKRKANFKAKF